MRDKRQLSVRFLLTLKGGTEVKHIYPSQSNEEGEQCALWFGRSVSCTYGDSAG